MQETKSLLRKQILKEKLGKQDSHYDPEKVFEPVTEKEKLSRNQIKLLCEKQIQALRDSTHITQAIKNLSQDQTKAIQDQTKTNQHSTNLLKKKLQKIS